MANPAGWGAAGVVGVWAKAPKQALKKTRVQTGILAEYGARTILSPDDNGEGAVAPCGAFDGLSMLQQNKGCPSLCGPVAQLGARFHGMEEVIGSIPIRSTKSSSSIQLPVDLDPNDMVHVSRLAD